MAKKGPCWQGYQMIGMKTKNGRRVPNCVPITKKSGGGMQDESEYGERKYSPVKNKKKLWINPMPYGDPGFSGKKKNRVIEAYTGKAIKQPTETQKEFKTRHKEHTATKGMMDYYKDII